MRSIFCAMVILPVSLFGQQLQIHYDLRHSVDPARASRNFPSMTFEFFKQMDTTGSFLLKIQTDMNGDRYTPNQTFIQLSQSLRFWRGPLYASLNYSGGLGIAPPAYGYAISNSFGIGIAYPFVTRRAWYSASVLYRYNAFARPSHDAQLNLYFGRGLFNYRVLIAASLVSWTENRNTASTVGAGEEGKKIAGFADPQIWYRIWRNLSIGSRISLYYHVLSEDSTVQCYPTVALRFEFK